MQQPRAPAHCPPALAGGPRRPWLADEAPIDLQHGVAADDHRGRVLLAPGSRRSASASCEGGRACRDSGRNIGRLGGRERLYLLGGGGCRTAIGGERAQDGGLVDVGDPYERLDARGAQGGQTAGGLRGQDDHGRHPR